MKIVFVKLNFIINILHMDIINKINDGNHSDIVSITVTVTDLIFTLEFKTENGNCGLIDLYGKKLRLNIDKSYTKLRYVKYIENSQMRDYENETREDMPYIVYWLTCFGSYVRVLLRSATRLYNFYYCFDKNRIEKTLEINFVSEIKKIINLYPVIDNICKLMVGTYKFNSINYFVKLITEKLYKYINSIKFIYLYNHSYPYDYQKLLNYLYNFKSLILVETLYQSKPGFLTPYKKIGKLYLRKIDACFISYRQKNNKIFNKLIYAAKIL